VPPDLDGAAGADPDHHRRRSRRGRLLTSSRRPPCDDDIVAAGLYLRPESAGCASPRRLVTGRRHGFARVLDPALTTVALDAELLGATAFELLVQRMAGGRPRRPTVLPAELIVRGSTGPPR
jgi:DNA-binding LacI/PurR family transcriptional regulator